MTKGPRERRSDLTPEQQQERVSTGGVGFEEPLRRVLVGGPDEHDQGEAMGNAPTYADHELTDEELVRRIRDAESRLRDGSAQVFYDADSLMHYWERRTQG